MVLEKVYKEFSEWLSLFFSTCISLIKVVLRLKFKGSLPQTVDTACIILGNGPSLKQSFEKYTPFIQKQQLMCVNNFSITAQYEQLRPKYYVMLDPSYWVGEPSELVTNTIKCLKEKTNWELHLLLPFNARKSSRLKALTEKNACVRISYFNYTVFKGFERIAHFFYRKNMAAPQSQNVLVACLFLAINCGFKKIYLLGADHTWHENLHINEENQLCIKDVHFYENEHKVSYRLFLKEPHKMETFKMHEIFTTLGKTFYGYEAIRKYAESRNVDIYNASEISFVDALKRIKLEQIA